VCFQGVVDLGAIDIERGRDHGLPGYNALRRAYGLAPKSTFTSITGGSENFPLDPLLTPGNEINDPNILDITSLTDKFGAPIAPDSPVVTTEATTSVQRATAASRLKAIYNGNIESVDAFAGMIAEPHPAGSEFGELQNAIWTRQFTALRDGDRFFYGNSPVLDQIRTTFGIDFRRTLGQVIASNTDIPAADLRPNVFVAPTSDPAAPSRIMATQSRRCLDVHGASHANGTPVEIFDCGAAGKSAQSWSQLARGGMIQVYGEKCLTVGGTGALGSPAIIGDCTNSPATQWRFNAAGDGHIVNVASGLCLDVNGGNTANATATIVFNCSGTAPNQRFTR
jgi:hypothetical protein